MIFFTPKGNREGKRGVEGRRKEEKEGIYFISSSVSLYKKPSKTFFGKNIIFFPLKSNIMFSPFKKLVCSCAFS